LLSFGNLLFKCNRELSRRAARSLCTRTHRGIPVNANGLQAVITVAVLVVALIAAALLIARERRQANRRRGRDNRYRGAF
jgi:hypothetical protein